MASLELNGADYPHYGLCHFLGMILSIAIFPLVLPKFWSKHYGTVSFIWAAITLIGLGLTLGFGISLHALIVVMFEQFFPFIFLLLSLFTITGGINLKGNLAGNPRLNTFILLIGAILCKLVGNYRSCSSVDSPFDQREQLADSQGSYYYLLHIYCCKHRRIAHTDW